jgi:hypothetical protein
MAKNFFITEKDKQRFWSKIDIRGPNECWLWLEGLDTDGYGHCWLSSANRSPSSHRISWQIENGPIAEELCVCHSCDVQYSIGDATYRRCCNPKHLWVGSNRDNIADRCTKGRSAIGAAITANRNTACGDRSGAHTHPERLTRGEQHWSKTQPDKLIRGESHYAAKVTDAIVVIVRYRLANSGITQKELARELGISPLIISRIVRRITWKHILP